MSLPLILSLALGVGSLVIVALLYAEFSGRHRRAELEEAVDGRWNGHVRRGGLFHADRIELRVDDVPGEITFTRTPQGARSRAAHWAKLISPAFDALYGGSVCEPIWPATDEMKSIVPRLAATIAGANAWAAFTAPTRFTRSTGSQSAGVRFQNGKPNLPLPMPAAYTRCCAGPSEFAASAAACCTAA